jgi:soluble lytic murein transglycosylase-like protein
MHCVISFRLRLSVLVTLVIASLPCFAAEVAVLRNGFSIRHERREVVGNITRLYVSADGSSFVDVPTAAIEHFEAAPDLPASTSMLPASGSRLPASAATVISQPSPFARTSQHAAPALNLNDVVSSASDRYRLDPDLVNSVIKAESGFNARAVSPKGALGLMQLMPGTASQLGVPDAFDPQANVEGGTKYLRELLELYNFDLVKALAAYNAGPRRVEQFNGVPPYYETRAYVARIVRDFNEKKTAQQKAATRAAAKSGTAKRTNRKTSTAAGKTQGSALVQAKVNAAQSSE